MSDLIAVAYPDEATAREVRDTLIELRRGHAIELEDIVVVTRDGGGKVNLDQPSLAAAGAAGGGDVGHADRAAVPGAAARRDPRGRVGRGRRRAEPPRHQGRLPARARREVTPDKVLPEIARFGGEVMQTSLNDEGERRLQEALRAGAGPAAET